MQCALNIRLISGFTKKVKQLAPTLYLSQNLLPGAGFNVRRSFYFVLIQALAQGLMFSRYGKKPQTTWLSYYD